MTTRRGLNFEVFAPKKGDVFFWHSSLAHAGTAVRKGELTRMSLVTHYSTRAGYPVERRNGGRRADGSEAEPIELNGGYLYPDPVHPGLEDVY